MIDNIQGRVLGQFARMRIGNPRIIGAHAAFNSLREARRIAPHEPQRFMTLFAPTHCGKSKTVQLYLEKIVVPELIAEGALRPDVDPAEAAKRQKRVLYYNLQGGETVNDLTAGLLTSLGDDNPYALTPRQRMRRCYGMLQDCKVELLIIDELNCLIASDRRFSDGTFRQKNGTVSMAVPDALRGMLNAGVVPMVFVGTPDAEQITQVDDQLARREAIPLRQKFLPLRWSVTEERKMFIAYCGSVGLMIQRHELVGNLPNFQKNGIPEKLYAASKGTIGIVSRIAEQATIHALTRKADDVEEEDLARAVEDIAMTLGIVDYNPFRQPAPSLKRAS